MSAACGTYAGYQRHWRRGEPSCDECRQAAAAYMRDYRQRNAAHRKRESTRTAAVQRALRRLARMHQGDYLRLLDEELGSGGAS